jgi:hypothetical protein
VSPERDTDNELRSMDPDIELRSMESKMDVVIGSPMMSDQEKDVASIKNSTFILSKLESLFYSFSI